jgi:hypothetical protein
MEIYGFNTAMVHSFDSRFQDDFQSHAQPFVAYLSFFPRSTLDGKPVSENGFDNPMVYEKSGEKEE